MTQFMEAVGWFLVAIAGLVGTLLALILGDSLVRQSGGPHAYGYVLPVLGLVMFVLPGLLIGWVLIACSRRRRKALDLST